MTKGVLMQPTPEQRNQVEVLAGFGVPQHQIAVLLRCDPKTLRKHFDDELSQGDAKATAKIAQMLCNKAVAGDTASLIFWLKARAGWREKHDVEISGRDGKPVEPTVVIYRWADDPPAAATPAPVDANATTTIEHEDEAD